MAGYIAIEYYVGLGTITIALLLVLNIVITSAFLPDKTKKYHAAEHMVFNLNRQEQIFNFENAKKQNSGSIYCGSIYAYFFIIIFPILYLLGAGSYIFLLTLALTQLSKIALDISLFFCKNKTIDSFDNIARYLQAPVVKEPGNKELALAVTAAHELIRAESGKTHESNIIIFPSKKDYQKKSV